MPATAELVRHLPEVKGIAQIAFTADGRHLYAMKGGQVVKVALVEGAVEAVALAGIEAVAALALDRAGRLYVSDPVTQTIKVFEKGRLLAEVGEPGGHLTGPFNQLRMSSPHNLAIEERAGGIARVWGIETGHWFRRVSVWDVAQLAKPTFHRHYVGNTGYQGSGGSISDDDPTIGLYRGVMFKVDYPNYTYEPIEMMGVGDWTGERAFGNGYHFWSDVSGKTHEY